MTATTTRFVPDALDHKLFATFPGLVMRKDLTHAIRGMSKAPSYVIEFMLSKYCANLFDDTDVREGLQLVQEEVACNVRKLHPSVHIAIKSQQDDSSRFVKIGAINPYRLTNRAAFSTGMACG